MVQKGKPSRTPSGGGGAAACDHFLHVSRTYPRKGGRPPSLNAKDLTAAKALLSDPEITVEEVARRLKVSPATLYRHLPGGRWAVGGKGRGGMTAFFITRSAAQASIGDAPPPGYTPQAGAYSHSANSIFSTFSIVTGNCWRNSAKWV
jgi:hypothetical protein